MLSVTINNDYCVFICCALPASFILTLIFAVPAIALAVRRMHDIGYSGWWVTIVVLIPVTGVILIPPRLDAVNFNAFCHFFHQFESTRMQFFCVFVHEQ
ncbi:DUF805 domain-containing protein [Escherichia coli]|uniref:DUF805 domain-containing protein n=1 Tax=Escherichia coli TaxID=562 RepID=UPI001FCCD48A|nr:DUF805 domain-containing protein [Escherichia coli]